MSKRISYRRNGRVACVTVDTAAAASSGEQLFNSSIHKNWCKMINKLCTPKIQILHLTKLKWFSKISILQYGLLLLLRVVSINIYNYSNTLHEYYTKFKASHTASNYISVISCENIMNRHHLYQSRNQYPRRWNYNELLYLFRFHINIDA